MDRLFAWTTPWVVATAVSLALAACGGSPRADADPTGSAPPVVVAPGSSPEGQAIAAPALALRLDGVKSLRFDWPAPVGTPSQALWVDPDGEGPLAPRELTAIAAEARTHSIEVFLPAALQARYRLRVCQSGACADSAWVGVDDLNPAIGYLKASNTAASDLFGWAVALSADGQRLAVAAMEEDGQAGGIDPDDSRPRTDWNTGAVYVFQREASGWRQEARIKSSNPDWGDSFGMDLDLSDDGRVLLVGTPNDDSPNSDPSLNGQPETGAAFVFERDGAGQWHQSAYLKPSASRANSQFGLHVALSGDGQWAAVNARNLVSMYATVFHRTASGWAQAALLPAGSHPDDQFAGRRLSLDREGRTLALGVATDAWPGQALNPAWPATPVRVGSVFVFERGQDDQWAQTARLRADTAAERMSFGWATALSADGRRLVVGASPREWDVAYRGGAYVFDRSASGWAQTAALLPPQTLPTMRAGFAVDISGDGRSLVVSDVEDSGAGIGLSPAGMAAQRGGAVNWYRWQDGGQWSLARRLKAPNNHGDLYFGWAVALSAPGDALAVGAVGEASAARGIGGDPSDRSAPFAGAAYLY